ncbi:MAG: hypothetical protein FJX70_04905 [Alphaproteobacteria bacterium]|nr:hypothetical protein [Alphaproteobacteria bacterium]
MQSLSLDVMAIDNNYIEMLGFLLNKIDQLHFDNHPIMTAIYNTSFITLKYMIEEPGDLNETRKC